MYLLSDKIEFPSVENADKMGVLAIGGDLSVERLLLAYRSGIFPWFNADEPIIWWSPNPRMVLFPERLKVSKSMQKLFRESAFTVTYNQNFREVMTRCGEVKRKNQDDTWITPKMIDAYAKLHQKGYVTSVEVWQERSLVGGLYGVYLKDKKVFCGESMFSEVSNASKYGFISLVKKLEKEGVRLIDCQVYTNHLASLGAIEISRKQFLQYL
ncbi:leucyl/phenylalanyl-tRNA--protein transferase [Mesonia sp. K7]|uniref:leucyl/phenylalanyl-tRNA--protein transferase n=1 Tax=Mesonia sp. K7 TaxID=2218606 RepID=UPI000DA9ACAA|nr:leucyl/phenylalanyl-tRNA--protein transferase [Mesonia sp. K7]PZD77756.1 leucyl/phenylalanyl-tRNA--protein transferase [Mesonia sp. K7]